MCVVECRGPTVKLEILDEFYRNPFDYLNFPQLFQICDGQLHAIQ